LKSKIIDRKRKLMRKREYMKYRKLGKTGLEVSIFGLGTEYLNKKPRKTVVSVVHEAIEKGINYFNQE